MTSANADDRPMSRQLAWVGIGLGAMELLAPSVVAKVSGAHDGVITRTILRACGVREIASGLVVLGVKNAPVSPVWLRVLGDAMDLSLLGAAAMIPGASRTKLLATTGMIMAITGMDTVEAIRATQAKKARSSSSKKKDGPVVVTITVRRPTEEIFEYLRQLESLPGFLYELDEQRHVKTESSSLLRHVTDELIPWKFETHEDASAKCITWRSAAGDAVGQSGSVRLKKAPGDRGTEVRIELQSSLPFGKAGELGAKLLAMSPEQRLTRSLRVLKQILETGEVMHSDASIHRGMHAGRPPRTKPRLPEPIINSRGNQGGLS